MMKRWRAASASSDVAARLRDALLRAQAAGAEAILGLLAALDGHGELDLLLLREEWLARRRLQVQAKIVGVVGPQGTRWFGHFVSLSSSRPDGYLGSVSGPRELGSSEWRSDSRRAKKTPWQPLIHMVRGWGCFCKATGDEGLVTTCGNGLR